MTHILGIGGSMRPDSSSERALRVATTAASEVGASIELFTGRDLVLPIYDPETRERTASVRRLLAAVKRADGFLIASPGYHGSVSGMIKNALDYVEDLREHERCYLDGTAVGCIAVASGWQSAVSTLSTLRATVHALRGWPTPLGVAINTAACTFDRDGRCSDNSIMTQLQFMALQVVNFARKWSDTSAPAVLNS
jgi:FMN reductase